MPRAALIALAAALLAGGGPAARADIYRYTDADGVVHFTNITPTGKGRQRWKKVMKTDPEVGKAAAERGDCAHCDLIPARDRSPERFTRYDDYIAEASALYQIPVPLIRAVIHVESSYDPRVVSSAGARGLMQLMPAVISDMGVRNAHDPRENILGGTRLLRVLANRFDGDLLLTIAGYHAGAAAIAKYNGVPPYERTRLYVRLVLGRYYKYVEKEQREARR